jgi:hypothetical protein
MTTVVRSYTPSGVVEHGPNDRPPWAKTRAEHFRTLVGLLQLAVSLSTLLVVLLR